MDLHIIFLDVEMGIHAEQKNPTLILRYGVFNWAESFSIIYRG